MEGYRITRSEKTRTGVEGDHRGDVEGEATTSVNYSVSEKAVLSACLADETHLSSAIALESLTEEDFTSPARQVIFALIAKRSDVNEVDVAIELPEYASEAIELSEMHGGGRVDRYA